MATTHAKAAGQGTRRHNERTLSGPSGPPEAGSPQTPHGCQTGSFFQTELSHREGGQHRDLHPRGPDAALRSMDSSFSSSCPPPHHRHQLMASHPASFQLSSSRHHPSTVYRPFFGRSLLKLLQARLQLV